MFVYNNRIFIQFQVHTELTGGKFTRKARDESNATYTRKDLLTLKDVKNINQKVIKENRLHQDDDISLQLLTRQWRKEKYSPVLLFKESAEQFIFGFQSKEQMEMMKSGLDNMMFLDTTHGTLTGGYQLLNILVLDKMKHGYPVAFFVVENIQTVTIVECLRKLKETDFAPKVLFNNFSFFPNLLLHFN